MNDLILITGASSGIGLEMAKELAEKKYDLILVARRIELLNGLKIQLEQNYNIKIIVMQSDLSDIKNVYELYNRIKLHDLKVAGLINNAGFGSYGEFADLPLDQDLEMIQVNISAVVALTKLFLKDMKLANYGKIMNIASLLSFLPFPYYSVYSATKSFILSFSETLAAELEGTGIRITTLCPGPIDTGFNTEGMLNTNAYKTNKPVDPKVVAAQGVELFLNGSGKKLVGFNNWFISNLPRITPDIIMIKIKKNLAKQRN